MGFGNQILQLAQGIIANDQQRQVLEQKEKQQELQVRQAERTLQLRRQEIEAREGFLNLQTQQLENKVAQESDPIAARARELDNEFMEERIATMRAERKAKSAGKEPESTSSVLRMGARRAQIVHDARVASTDRAITEILDSPTPSIPGVNSDVVADALSSAGVRSWEGLEAAIENAHKGVRSVENAQLPSVLKVPRLEAAEASRNTLTAARAELRKIFDQEPDFASFQRASNLPVQFARSLFEDAIPSAAQKVGIWGQPIFRNGLSRTLDTAIAALRDDGNEALLRGFIQTQPGSLLDEDGRISPQGMRQLGGLMFGEGISQSAMIDFVRKFNAK